MNSRPLGSTGLVVSEIGFGAWGIGGAGGGPVSYGYTDDKESTAALRRAHALGVTFYDTADLYGQGHSEALIGTTFKLVRHATIIASKVGYLAHGGPQDFSPTHIRSALEGSLKRLQTDYLDLYQLHDPPIELLLQRPEILATLDVLKREGKIRALGISLRSPADGVLAIRKLGFKSLQVNFNMLDQRAIEHGLFEACVTEGAGVICRTPLSFGFLTGRYSAESEFGPDDHRSSWPQEQRALWATAFNRFAPALHAQGLSHTQVALRYCLSYPSVATVIPGMLTPSHVEENVIASKRGPLPPEERSAIERVYSENSFFLGPVRS